MRVKERGAAEADLRRYYDALSRTLLGRRRGEGEGAEHLSMHRILADPDAPSEAPSQLVLERLVRRAIVWPDSAATWRAVDLGCGYGGVTLRLAGDEGGSWLGITLSPVQAERARRAAEEAGLSDRVRFEVASYDDMFAAPGAFSVAIAIESLVHSHDKAASLRAIAAVLAPGAQLVIVDDMSAVPSAGGDSAAQLEAARSSFAKGWLAPDAPDEARWRALLEGAGFEIDAVQDLTAHTRPRSSETLASLEARARRSRLWALGRSKKAVIDGVLGGLALERLYLAGAMRYVMIRARKSARAS